MGITEKGLKKQLEYKQLQYKKTEEKILELNNILVLLQEEITGLKKEIEKFGLEKIGNCFNRLLKKGFTEQEIMEIIKFTEQEFMEIIEFGRKELHKGEIENVSTSNKMG
jgi:hypothetical protein